MNNNTNNIITTTTITTADGAEPSITINWEEHTWGCTTYYGEEAVAIATRIADGLTIDEALWEAIEQKEVGFWPNETGDCDSEIDYRVVDSNLID